MQNKISKHYLDEARRIRKEYLENLKKIKDKKPLIDQHRQEVEKYNKDVELLPESGLEGEKLEREFYSKVEKLLENIEIIENSIKPFYEKIEQLKKDSFKLNEIIKEKYPTLTQQEIKQQIIPYVQDLK